MQMLDKGTYRLLEKLYHVQKMEESELFLFVGHTDAHRLEPHSHLLLQQRMIKVHDVGGAPDEEGGNVGAKRIYEIDLPGKSYVEWSRQSRRKDRANLVRYIITTVIAVIALIKSFLPEIAEFLGRILPPT